MSKEHMSSRGDTEHLFFIKSEERTITCLKWKYYVGMMLRDCPTKGHVKVNLWLHNHHNLSKNHLKNVTIVC